MRCHDNQYTARQIVRFYEEDEQRLEALKAQDKLTKRELFELERIKKAKALVIRTAACLKA